MQHGCGRPTTGEFTVEELTAAVDEAKAFERKVMAHAHSPLGIKNAVAAGVASIEHGTMLDKPCAELMAANGTFLVPTLSVWDPAKHSVPRPADFEAKAQMVREHHDEAFQFALERGVKIALGSDSCVRAHDRGARELHHMVRLGMTGMDTIRSATVLAAELLGVSDIGTLQPGHRADIIAVHGNPLRQIDVFDDIVFVMKDGVV
jgi:imidazolonepropionase-like amidohydrolase